MKPGIFLRLSICRQSVSRHHRLITGVLLLYSLTHLTIVAYTTLWSEVQHRKLPGGNREGKPEIFNAETSYFNESWHVQFSNITRRRGQTEVTYRKQPRIQLSESEKKNLEVLLRRGIVKPSSDLVTTDTKVILWYTSTRYNPVLQRLHPLRGCPNAPCRVTTNRYFYDQSDALIFTAQLLQKHPPRKLRSQVWVLHNHESPRWVNRRSALYTPPWKSVFNWTLDYRFDSDIRDPYAIFKTKNGRFQKQEESTSRNHTRVLSLKNATVAWMVSNCNSMSKRNEYVKELRKYVDIDVFGSCGTKRCPRSEDDVCFNFLSMHYKFYLAFENAFCKDYITEKVFRYYNSDMVLIVRGGGDYTRQVPPGTYINTADFKTVKDLADYINMLDRDDEKYLSILRTKDQYKPIFEDYLILRDGHIDYVTYHYDMVPMCELCYRLWNTEEYKKHYKDITEWFDRGLCYIPQDYP